jgi:histone H3/H4
MDEQSAAMEVEEQKPPKDPRRAVSRAALQRLAADVGARLPTASYEAEADDIEAFVRAVVIQAVRAGTCTGRRAVGRAQVQYGLRAAGFPAPAEVLRLSDAELRRMRRCNVRAPAKTRRASALCVEIPEASFARLLSKSTAAVMPQGAPTVRFSAAARRVLHAAVEARSAKRFAADGAPSSADSASLLPGVARVLEARGVKAEVATTTSAALERICAALESLLEIGNCVTVSPAHVAAALESVHVAPRSSDLEAEPVFAALERAVRGRLPDRRFQSGAIRLLAASLLAA